MNGRDALDPLATLNLPSQGHPVRRRRWPARLMVER